MKTRRQNFFLFLKTSLAAVVLLFVGVFVFRNELLKQIIAKTAYKMAVDYDCKFAIKKASFVGLDGLKFTDIELTPRKGAAILKISQIETTVNLWQLLLGNVQLGRLVVGEGFLQLVHDKTGSNWDTFFRKDKNKALENSKRNYAQKAYAIITQISNLIPTDMLVENLDFRIVYNTKKTKLHFSKLSLKNKQLTTDLKLENNNQKQQIQINGLADPRNKKADIRICSLDSTAVVLPYFDLRYNLKSSFETIRLQIKSISKQGSELRINGLADVVNLKLNHPKIARRDVFMNKVSLDFVGLLGSHSIALDKGSSINFNKIKCLPYVSYENENDAIYTLELAIPKMKGQDFITSLPAGLFSHFQGMQLAGNFGYRFKFRFNKNNSRALIFDSKLDKDNLQIVKYGTANLSKLNTDFNYSAIINNVPQRSILVGAENPNYTTLDQISLYLQKCVLTAEDPSFFLHRGFIVEAFKQSILKNFRTNKFSRGASTLSMQLVKNVFLTREKTLSRKLEEILLVYLLENNKIATKERMLEVYFNIIEWGPDVYGIGEASEFYFQKKPADLNLQECLFLTTIIPKPTKFMKQFDENGVLKKQATNYSKRLQNLMLKRSLLIPDDTLNQVIKLQLLGRSRLFLNIKKQDSTRIDSLPTKPLLKLE